MSCCEQRLDQPSVRDMNAAESRASFSQEASCCRGPGCQSQPVDSAFVGSSGDVQLVNTGAPMNQTARYDEVQDHSHYRQPHAYGVRYPQLPGYGRGNFGHQRPSLAHTISDVVTQGHGGHHQQFGYGRGNFDYQRSNIPHVISDVITQQHSGYNQPYGYGFGNSGYQRSNIPHVISDVITQQHNGGSYYNNPHGYQHRGGHGGGLQFNFGFGGRHHR